MTKRRKSRATARAGILAAALFFLPALGAEKESPVSKPGLYSGYTRAIYNGWLRSSEYIVMRDGARLAADTFRPAQDGKPAEEPLPVIWTLDRYHRADLRDGQLYTQLDQYPWLQVVLKHGYVVGVVDARGSGASFGTWQGPATDAEARDTYDITEWYARQPWCNGKIGMFGRSNLGMNQYTASSMAPPHLKAILPEMAPSDLYSLAYPGGVFRHDWAEKGGRLLKQLDTATPAAAVDQDGSAKMLARAVKDHEGNRDFFELLSGLAYRDSRDKKTGIAPYLNWSHANYVSKVKASGVAVYHLAGWYDAFPRDALIWYRNLNNPQKITIGPWPHEGSAGFDLASEHLRWYDYWLKGIDNGVMSEAPINYYTVGAAPGEEWRQTREWPLPEQQSVKYYLHGESPEDGGRLLAAAPEGNDGGADEYRVDYSTTSGKGSRWANLYGEAFSPRDMAQNDRKALTYTTPPLAEDTELTGHPVAHIWVGSTAKDGDFFVYLEDVMENGYSANVTEGVLRASHRKTSDPPVDYFGLPYHRSFEEDLAVLPGEPAEMVIDLLPISKVFKAGHRIRLAIACADKDNAATQELNPPPVISLWRDASHASHVILPIVPKAQGALETGRPPRSPDFLHRWRVAVIIAVASLISALTIILTRNKRRRNSG